MKGTKIDGLFGRTAEVAALGAFLGDVAAGPSLLVIEGDLGAGKTALWRAAAEAARQANHHVLISRATEAEASLAFAALGDLLRDVLDRGLPHLPPPQATALRVALLLQEPDGQVPEPLAVSVATLGLLRGLAAERPVLIALDDFAWLDAASANVLAFVLRRLESERIGVVGTVRRDGERAPLRGLLDEATTGRDPNRLVAGPLTRDAIEALLASEIDAAIPPPLVTEITSSSGGNPLFALEIGRGIERGEIVHQPGQPLAVPATLRDLVVHRVGRLEPLVREALFVAAAVPDPTIELLRAVLPEIRRAEGLQPAVGAGVIQLRDGHVTFRHPLFASTVYHAMPPDRRRVLHGRLATEVHGAQERARQLSLATEGPDEVVATALDEAASAASRRGAPSVAADLAEQAWALTPPAGREARERRQSAAAAFHMAAGNLPRARALLERLAEHLAPGSVRSETLRCLATVRYRQDSPAVAAELLGKALAEAGADASLRACIERDLAWAVIACGDVRDARNHTRAALALIEDKETPALRGQILAADALTSFLLGDGFDEARMRESLTLDDSDSAVPVEWRPSMMLASMLRWSGDLAGARQQLDGLHRQTTEAGDEASLPYLLMQRSETATLAGELRTALEYAEAADTIAVSMGQEPIRAGVLYARSLAAAHLGMTDEARRFALEGLALAHETGAVLTMLLNQTVLGFLELSLDRPSTAHEWLGPLLRWVDVISIQDPGILRFVPDEAEALVALGDLAEADDLLSRYEADARRLGRPAAVLGAARARAILCASAGDPSAGAALLQQALRQWESAVPPFDRARARLVLGTVLRRTLRRREAREALEEAVTGFGEVGARLWVEKAERMLGGPDEPSLEVLQPLTAAERRVAELVAGGATNRAAADHLFVSVRAVEVHLTSIYRKLGLRSRTELAGLLARAEPASVAIPRPSRRWAPANERRSRSEARRSHE